MNGTRRVFVGAVTTLAVATAVGAPVAHAASRRRIAQDVNHALATLYAVQPRAHDLVGRAKAILVFPNILKAGLVVGAQTGNGALMVGGRIVAYYNISAASYGLQAGAQVFSYALFFMTDSALKYLQNSNGWAIGSGPSVVVLDKGAATGLTSTTLTQDVYAFPFRQQGLMAGIGLEGSKITRIYPGA